MGAKVAYWKSPTRGYLGSVWMLRLLTHSFRATFQSKCKASHLQKAGNVTLHFSIHVSQAGGLGILWNVEI